jgi:hypothetical protein
VIMWNFEVTSGKFEVENSIWEIYAEKWSQNTVIINFSQACPVHLNIGAVISASQNC